MNRLATAGRTRLPGAPALAVLAAVLLLLASMEPATAFGGAGATDPVGVWPLQPEPPLVRRFEPPSSTWGPGHRGVDLAGGVGQVVHAAMAGTVTFAGSLAGRGVVVVDHGDTRTTYEPVTASVAVGTVVATGDPIGILALAQSHCLPAACLHWGWIRNVDDVYLDPLGLLGLGAPVRLLPLWRADPVARLPASAPAPRLPYAGWRSPVVRWLA